MSSSDVAAASSPRRVADWLWSAQLALAMCLGLCCLLLDLKAAYSALLGGVICAVGTWILASVMFARRARAARAMVVAMYLGKAAQAIWTLTAFLLSLWLLELNAITFFSAYTLCLTLNWVALLLPDKQP